LKSLRTILEKLSRGKVVKRRISVGGKTIPLMVSPDAQLKYLKFGPGAFDQDLIKLAENYLKVTSNVWDVGANVGVFTFAASSVANKGTVVSIEADIWLADILRKTTKLEEYSKNSICVLPVAISNNNSVASFLVAERGRASNSLEAGIEPSRQSQMGGVREKQYVPTLTLDTLLESFPAPEFVKIDIEGAELMALQGATEIINKIRPIFCIEVGSNFSNEIFQMFKLAGYVAIDYSGNKLVDECAYNTIFLPEDSANF